MIVEWRPPSTYKKNKRDSFRTFKVADKSQPNTLAFDTSVYCQMKVYNDSIRICYSYTKMTWKPINDHWVFKDPDSAINFFNDYRDKYKNIKNLIPDFEEKIRSNFEDMAWEL